MNAVLPLADAADGKCVTVDGNRLTLLTEGPVRRTVLLDLIDGARSTLRLLYYIYRADK